MEENLVDELSDEVHEALFQIAKSILKTDNFKVQSEPGSKKGDNFIGIVHRISLNTVDKKHSSSLFLKMAPTDESTRVTLQIHSCFMFESYAYEVIFPYFREFQMSRNALMGGFHEHPICYKSIKSEPNECMFFQDMAQDKFVMIDKTKLTIDHVLLVMKTLAKFHAVSFAIRDQQPEKFRELISELKEMVFVRGMDSKFRASINNAEMNAINSITNDDDSELVKVLLDVYETNQYDLISDLIDANSAEPYAVICHGDLWNNNVMFKHDETKNVQDISFIDWQLIRYGSPVLDIMFYLFNSTTRELRGRNYNIYLKTYYESLSSLLTRLGSDPERVFPFRVFQEQLQKYGKYGLLTATFFLPLHVGEMTFEDNGHGKQLSDAFKKRFRDIVADSHRLGYI